MEGVRDPAGAHPYLGIEGASGRMTLSVANLAARDELISKIGTPENRGSRVLPFHGDEFRAWELMASYARDIEHEDFPYIAFGLPGSPTPTINSSSAIASLVYYSGLDPSLRLPFGMHLSPGMTTLLGTGGDDPMRMERGFTTLLGGSGNDTFAGSIDPDQIEKFYGGCDDDVFRWSVGFNIVHGGEPHLDYADDGTDVMDYSGAGTVTISFNRHWIPHKVPSYVVVIENGLDHLYSIERIQWNETTDHIVLGDGVDLVEDDVILAPGSQPGRSEHPHQRSGRLLSPSTNQFIGDDADNVIAGGAGDDTLYGGGGNDVLNGGTGSDGYVYLPGDGDDVIIDAGGPGADELVLAGGVAPEDVSLYRLGQAPGDLLLALAGGGSIRLKGFFDGGTTSIERIVFDRAPAWTRDGLEALAASAPVMEQVAELAHPGDELIFRPGLAGDEQTAANAATSVDDLLVRGHAAPGLADLEGSSAASIDLSFGFTLHWLF